MVTSGIASSWCDGVARNPRLVLGISLVLAICAAAYDLSVEDRFPLIVCFLPSLWLACWLSPVAVGTSLAALCSSIWLIDDCLEFEGERFTQAAMWMTVIHFFFFLVILNMQVRLRAAYRRERDLARHDGLTGLLNAAAFRETADQELERSRRSGRPLAAAFIDCDNFKTVNDTLGHSEGDRLLQKIACVMGGSVRAIDTLARIGGDEFAILLPAASEAEAESVTTRLRASLQASMDEAGWPVTFSIGVAVYARPPKSVDALIRGADVLMYAVKNQEKDAVRLELVA